MLRALQMLTHARVQLLVQAPGWQAMGLQESRAVLLTSSEEKTQALVLQRIPCVRAAQLVREYCGLLVAAPPPTTGTTSVWVNPQGKPLANLRSLVVGVVQAILPAKRIAPHRCVCVCVCVCVCAWRVRVCYAVLCCAVLCCAVCVCVCVCVC